MPNSIALPKVSLMRGLTISPPHVNGIDGGSVSLLRKWQKLLKPMLHRCCTAYTVYPEFDDSGRLHFHGYYWVNKSVDHKLMLNTLRRICFIKYESRLKHPGNWKKYCSKDLPETLEVFSRSLKDVSGTDDIIIDNRNCLTYLNESDLEDITQTLLGLYLNRRHLATKSGALSFFSGTEGAKGVKLVSQPSATSTGVQEKNSDPI